MGSGLAGAKAGILGGIFLAGAIGLFNMALLFAFKGDVIHALQATSSCQGGGFTAEDCFSTLLWVSIPTFVMFTMGLLGIVFGSFFGSVFEYMPGFSYRVRALSIAALLLAFMLLLGTFGLPVAGFSADNTEKTILVGFDTMAVILYSLILAHFYRRYTREVQFETTREGLKVFVDDRDFTGRTRTFTLHSAHRIRAPTARGGFKEWLVSGGVSVDDVKSFETTMLVEGDGLLKVS